MLTGCASLSTGAARESDDPLEPVNRVVFDANMALDDWVVEPVAKAYRWILPEFIRNRVRSVVDNLAEPRIFVNNVLQLRVNAAGITFARFFINTLAGIGGMFDLATPEGFPRQAGDFGLTLATWGVGNWPYVVLPFFGPSNFRDTVGLGVDIVTTPPALVVDGGIVFNIAVGGVNAMDLRARNIESLNEIKANAIDLYAYFKSITQQRREAEVREARGVTEEPPELVDPGAPENEPQE